MINVDRFRFINYRNPDGQNMPGCETYRDTMRYLAEQTDKIASRVLRSYWGGMLPSEQLSIEYMNLNRHSAIRDVVSVNSEQGLKDCFIAIMHSQGKHIERMLDYTKWNKEKRTWERSE